MPESDHLYERLYNMMVEPYTDHILERSIKSTGRIRGRGWVQKEVREVFCYHSLWPAPSVHLFDTKTVAYHSKPLISTALQQGCR